MDFSRVGAVEAGGAAYCAHVQPRVGGKRRHIRGPNRPDQQAARYRRPSVAGGTVALPFGAKEIPNGTSLAMYPSVGSASQAQGYVNKEQRAFSDAPSGRFFEPLARRLPEIRGGIFPSVPF